MQTQREIDGLTQMRYRELIDDTEYLRQKKELQTRLNKLKEELGDTERRAENWTELTERTFDFITYAAYHFNKETFEEKRKILRGFGSNFLIKDKKLEMLAQKWLVPIGDEYKTLEKEYLALEPEKMPLESGKSEAIEQIRLKWRRERDSNPRGACAPNGFQDRRVRPLCHPSAGFKQSYRSKSAGILTELSADFKKNLVFSKA